MPYQITTYQDTSYQDTGYQDTTGTGGGGTTPYDQDPPFGPPLLWEAVLADLSVFFDELGGPVVEHGNDQNSYYDDPAAALRWASCFSSHSAGCLTSKTWPALIISTI